MNTPTVTKTHARQIASLLTAEAAQHPNFFIEVQASLKKLGYRLSAEQRGVEGTHLRVVKNDS